MSSGKAAIVLALLAALAAVADRGTAQRQVEEGDRAMQVNDLEGASAAYSRAIQEDPGWATAWARRGLSKQYAAKFPLAVEDYGRAVALEPANPQWLLLRSQALMALDLWGAARDDADALLRLNPAMPEALCVRGWARVNLGEVDAGLAEQDRAFEASRGHPEFRARFDAYFRKADWPALTAEAEAAIAGGARRGGLAFYRIVGLVEQGKYDAAQAAIEDARRRNQPWDAGMGAAWLLGTPGAPGHDADAARRTLHAVPEVTISYYVNTEARALYLGDRAADALDLLATRAGRTSFDTLFWLAAAHWKTGRFPEARVLLRDARRLNPYLMRHAEKLDGFRDFAASVDREIAAEGGAPGDRDRLDHERATHLLTVAEIEALVREYRFARAVAEYEALLKAVSSSVRRAEIEARLPEVRGLAGAHAKLVAAVAGGKLKLKTKVAATDLELIGADERAFQFAIKGGGGRFPWAFLDPAVYADFALQAGPEPGEILGLGCLAWDAGRAELAMKLFDEAVKGRGVLRAAVAAFVARRRGIAAPEGGFIAWRGRYVTPDEKANLEKGLVEWQGSWVAPKDREMLAKGMVKVGEKWVSGDEADLVKRGFRKYKDRWMAREDYDALRADWAEGFSEKTTNFVVRTNTTEAFAKDLAALAEAAWTELVRHHGGREPKLGGDGRIVLHAYRTYEDYRRYCIETKAEDRLNAAGFARSDSNTVAGWNKTGNERQFLQTMIHEAAHLFAMRAAPAAAPPSWYAEGHATFFEGFRWDGRKYVFDFVSDSRLPFAREAMKAGRQIPLKELLTLDALALINSDTRRALLFYAESWALHFFLAQTQDPALQAGWAKYRASVESGEKKGLLEFFPDPAALEKSWLEFIIGL